MLRISLPAATAVALSLCFCLARAQTAAPPSHPCDQLVAHPSDPMKVGPGANFDEMIAAEAVAACEEAVARHPGAARFEYQLGRAMSKAGKNEAAILWYRKAAEKGYAAAMFGIAVNHRDGTGLPKDDQEAARWFSLAADAGHTEAMNILAWWHRTGRGVPKSEAESERWLRKAAEASHLRSMNDLGISESRKGNLAEAVQWYRRAAEKGDAHATYNLAMAYSQGRGVTQDAKEAVRLLGKAAELEHPGAMFQIALIEKRSEWKDVLTIGMHCVVSTASAPIRSELNGPVTGHAAKGEWYYLDHWPISNKDKSGATLIEVKRPLGARLENAGLIKVADLDCEHWERSDGFPVLFDDPRRLRPLGVDFWFTHKSSGSPYQMCFHNGSVQDENGLPKLYLSKEFRRHHRDYNFHKLCLVMRSGVIRFDPESGQRLPSFIMINREYLAKGDGYEGLAISDEIPLVAPPCLNKGDFDQATSFAAKLSLSGCSMRYHPWSGRELNEEERKLWRTAFISVTSESAPDPSPEAVRVVKERPSSASEAEIARLTRALKAR